mmetsp:Transcript_490/g.1087  ORF Transcript_490/g.1087 Transcript_490/m.1087 type:complete len:219 (+) Transcript_490:110-766(+)
MYTKTCNQHILFVQKQKAFPHLLTTPWCSALFPSRTLLGRFELRNLAGQCNIAKAPLLISKGIGLCLFKPDRFLFHLFELPRREPPRKPDTGNAEAPRALWRYLWRPDRRRRQLRTSPSRVLELVVRLLVADLEERGHLVVELLRLHLDIPRLVVAEEQRGVLGDQLPIPLPVRVVVVDRRALPARAAQLLLALHELLDVLLPHLDVVALVDADGGAT